MEKFEREHRYLVLKISDINEICTDEIKGRLEDIALMVERGRAYQGKPPLTCVVVESDWPEYEPTWKALEQRMTSAPQSEQTHVRVPDYDRFGYALAMRVLQSDLYRKLDERERADCDELIRAATGKESG